MVGFAVTAFTSIFIIVDPPGNIATFISLTEGYNDERRRHAARVACLTCFALLSVFALAGPAIMSFFSISLPALRIAGGIILFVIGMEMLNPQRPRAKATPEEEREWSERGDVGLVPLGVPLLAGPGAISTVIVLAQTGPELLSIPTVIGCIAVTSALTYVTMVRSEHLARLFGRAGINITVRLMGLILTAIGVQLALDGMAGVFPGVFKRVLT
ncbi:MAG: MarC family protein [Pseudomonadota bacterium]